MATNSETASEWIDNKGDVWTVERCGCDPDGTDRSCVVVKRWLTKRAPDYAALAQYLSPVEVGEYKRVVAEERANAEPTDELHIPHDVLPNVIAELQRILAEAPAEDEL